MTYLRQEKIQPALFVGHGSPENGILDNQFTSTWKELGKSINAPKAILSISAHWLTDGTYVHSSTHPRTIHDFYGFQEELYALEYNAPGSPETAKDVQSKDSSILSDTSWGFDHGTWVPLLHMFPGQNIPVFQMSLDYKKTNEEHYALGKRLAELRKEGVLILGSGNIVHNLRMIDPRESMIFDWAESTDKAAAEYIVKGEHDKLMHPFISHPDFIKAIPTPEHYWPLLYILASQSSEDPLSFFNEGIVHGSIAMRGVRIG